METISKNYTTIQTLIKEIETDKHLLGSIACSFLWNYEGFIDTYGLPVFIRGKATVKGVDGYEITTGVIEHWETKSTV